MSARSLFSSGRGCSGSPTVVLLATTRTRAPLLRDFKPAGEVRVERNGWRTAALTTGGVVFGVGIGVLLAGSWSESEFLSLVVGFTGVCLCQTVLCFLVVSAKNDLRRVDQERIVGRRILRLRQPEEGEK